jgi:hypothetical protein
LMIQLIVSLRSTRGLIVKNRAVEPSHEFKSLVQQNNKTCCRIIGRYELHAFDEGRAG